MQQEQFSTYCRGCEREVATTVPRGTSVNWIRCAQCRTPIPTDPQRADPVL